MGDKTTVTKRIKMMGVTYSVTFICGKEGWKVFSVGKPSNRMPLSFTPFEVMDLAMQRVKPTFPTIDAAVAYVRSGIPA